MLSLLTASTSATAKQTGDDTLLERIGTLDADFVEATDHWYRSAGERHDKTFPNMQSLLLHWDNAHANGSALERITLLYAHADLLQEQFDHPRIFELADYLLKHNSRKLAEQILVRIQQENDRSLMASIKLVFARYHASREEWSACLAHLGESTIGELGGDQAAHANLLKGAALQHLKQHRRAIDVLKRVDQKSPWFLHARLNLAIANIRQGWLSEAARELKQVIALARHKQQSTLADRLYLVLGYAFLQQEYYRDARDAFRQIDRNSPYLNRALLGLGLSASSQTDFVGALNALALLKERSLQDLPLAESYLVIPYLYEKLQDETIVSTSYREAMQFYQARLDELEALRSTVFDLDDITVDAETGAIRIGPLSMDATPGVPAYFLTNYRHLESLVDSGTAASSKPLLNLHTAYRRAFDELIDRLLQQRQSQLQSYLSQSRFGLAQLYDQPVNDSQ